MSEGQYGTWSCHRPFQQISPGTHPLACHSSHIQRWCWVGNSLKGMWLLVSRFEPGSWGPESACAAGIKGLRTRGAMPGCNLRITLPHNLGRERPEAARYPCCWMAGVGDVAAECKATVWYTRPHGQGQNERMQPQLSAESHIAPPAQQREHAQRRCWQLQRGV